MQRTLHLHNTERFKTKQQLIKVVSDRRRWKNLFLTPGVGGATSLNLRLNGKIKKYDKIKLYPYQERKG